MWMCPCLYCISVILTVAPVSAQSTFPVRFSRCTYFHPDLLSTRWVQNRLGRRAGSRAHRSNRPIRAPLDSVLLSKCPPENTAESWPKLDPRTGAYFKADFTAGYLLSTKDRYKFGRICSMLGGNRQNGPKLAEATRDSVDTRPLVCLCVCVRNLAR